MRPGNACKRGIAQQAGAGAAERRIGHHRHAVPLAPWQQVMLDIAVREVVKDLISRAAIAAWNTEQVFHVTDLKVGHAPSANLARRAQAFERCYNAGEVGVSTGPVQQIEIEMIGAETGEARLASPRDAVSRDVIGPHFGDQEYAVALTGNHAADQFLGAAVAVQLRRIDQRHPKRNARAQHFFLNGFRMFPLRETCRALTERRDDCSVAELYRTPCTVRSRASGRSTSRCT